MKVLSKKEIVAKKHLLIEYKGFVLLDGKVIKQRRRWLMLATYIGLLAGPVDLHKMQAEQRAEGRGLLSRRPSSMRSASGYELPQMQA